MTPDAPSIVTFVDCVRQAFSTPELIAEFDRLSKSNLSRHGAGLDLMIDDATGRRDTDLEQFIRFVREFIWDRLPPEIKAPDVVTMILDATTESP
jgi:hypothetical protein